MARSALHRGAAGRSDPAARSRSGRVAGRLWAILPEGRPLPEQAWRGRHRAVLVLLWLHAPGLTAFGVGSGYGLAHSATEGGAATWRGPSPWGSPGT